MIWQWEGGTYETPYTLAIFGPDSGHDLVNTHIDNLLKFSGYDIVLEVSLNYVKPVRVEPYKYDWVVFLNLL